LFFFAQAAGLLLFALAKKVNKIAFGKNKVGLQHTTKQGT